jgi:hypothetical protein
MLPKNSIIYRGASVRQFDLEDPLLPDVPKWVYTQAVYGVTSKNELIHQPKFFGDLSIASFYGFSGDWHNRSFGKVVAYRITKNVIIIDTSNLENLQKLWTYNNEDFNYAFQWKNNQFRRVSVSDADHGVMQFLHKNFTPLGIHGFGYTKIPKFHAELGLFDPPTVTQRTKFEYRLVASNTLIETYDGHFTGTVIDMKNTTIEYDNRQEKLYLDSDEYEPDRNNWADAFYFWSEKKWPDERTYEDTYENNPIFSEKLLTQQRPRKMYHDYLLFLKLNKIMDKSLMITHQ